MTTDIATNDLPTKFADMTDEQKQALMKSMGMDAPEKELGNRLPSLRVNYEAEYQEEEDQEPIPLKRGTFKIQTVDADGEKVTVYSKEANLRPYNKANMYSAYDSDSNSSAVASTYYTNGKDIIYDTLGNEYSGYEYKKKVLALFPQFSETLKCQNVIYGTVTMPDATDMNGNKVEVKDLPCVWYSKGASFMTVVEAYKELSAKGQLPVMRDLQLTTTRKKTGSVTYFPIEAQWSVPKYEEYDMELANNFTTTMKEETKTIIKAFKQVKSKTSVDEEIAGTFNGDLDADFADDLPEDMLAAG